MARFKQFPVVPHWVAPNQSDVLTPDANGATLDPQGLLTGPIVWNSDGSIDFPVSGGVAQTNPNMGAVVVLPWRDDANIIALRSPSAFGLRADIIAAPLASSGAVVWAGIANDAALLSVVWSGMDFDAANPRANAANDAVVNVSGTRTGIGSFSGSANFVPGALVTDDVQLKALTTALVNTVGKTTNTTANRTASTDLQGQTFFCFGVFGHAALAGQTISLAPSSFYRQLLEGERY